MYGLQEIKFGMVKLYEGTLAAKGPLLYVNIILKYQQMGALWWYK